MKFHYVILILLSSFTSSLWAQNIQVEYGFNIYALSITSEEITYKKKEYEAVVKKEACSTKLFNDFTQRFAILNSEKPADQASGSEFLVKYKIDERQGILTPQHPYAQTLLSIPKSFDVFKLATEIRCQKGKK